MASPPLGASFEIVGFDEAQGATTELGKAVNDLEPLADKVGKVMEQLSDALAKFTESVDEEVGRARRREEESDEKRKTAAEKEAAADRSAEEARLKSSMAQLVGGGVNMIAYQQQLGKLKEQIEMIRQAEQRRIVSHKDASEAVKKLEKEYSKLNVEAKAYALAGGGSMGRMAAGAVNRLTAIPSQTLGAAKNQVMGIGTGLMGLVPILATGGIFGLLLHGVSFKDKIAAETGEIVNIAVSASGKLSSSGTAFLSSFQHRAEHYYGINRQEIQGVLKTFTEAGMNINDIIDKRMSKSLGEVGQNILTLTVGLDKHFEVASGTSAKAVVSLVHDYGMNLQTAGDLYTRMAFAGQKSGMGVQQFTSSVLQASNTLRMYGVSVESVAVMLQKLQTHYEGMGMPKQLAGTQANMALQQISQGMAGLSSGWQAYFGERMGMGTGLEAKMRFQDGMTRLSKGGDNEFMTGFIQQAYASAMESAGGDKTQARYILQQTGVAGGFEGAKAITDIGDKLSSGVKLNQLSLQEQKSLKDAFKTEGQKTSDLAKNMHTIMTGLAGVGEGLLQIITNLVAVSIVFYKTLPTMIFGSDTERNQIITEYGKFFKGVEQGYDTAIKGGKLALLGARNVMEPILDPLMRAVKWDPKVHQSYTDIETWNLQNARYKAVSDIAEGSETGRIARAAREKGEQMEQGSGSVERAVGTAFKYIGGAAEGLTHIVTSAGVSMLGDYPIRSQTERYMRESSVARYTRESEAAPMPSPAPASPQLASGKESRTTILSATVTVHQPPGAGRPATTNR